MHYSTQRKLDRLTETKTAIKDALIEKGQTVSDTDTFFSYAEKIRNLENAQSPDVKYVTFMNNDAELYVKAVATGDDCVDVVTKGLVPTPTKASTNYYTYTHSGWSSTNGGEADSECLKNVTENKTVYAAFTEHIRYYTITYLDTDGSTLKTEQYQYGATPSTYNPEKDGYLFVGWNPSVTTVTKDITYTAVWEESLTFAAASWATVCEKAKDGTAASLWAVGDSKNLVLNYADGTSETLTIKIAAFNTNVASQYDTERIANMVLVTTDLMANYQYLDDTNTGNMVITGSSYDDIYDQFEVKLNECHINTFFKDTVLPALPSPLQENIMPRKYSLYDERVDGVYVDRIYHEAELWLPLYEDVGSIWNNPVLADVIDLVKPSTAMLKRRSSSSYENWRVWNLNLTKQSTSRIDFSLSNYVTSSGSVSSSGGAWNTQMGVIFGFCI